MILDEILAHTKVRVAQAKRRVSPAALERDADGYPKNPSFPFARALAAPGLSLLCEVKKASPSKGLIAPNFDPVNIAQSYAAAGADAISVLTEPDFFLGADAYLREIRAAVTLPLLRKDFVIDIYQIYEAKCLGADAVLLICACLQDDAQLRDFHQTATALGLSCLVECRDEAEIERALCAGAHIVGVNNRDLRTFTVSAQTSVRLAPLIPKEVIFVSESGISTPADARLLREAGADALLIGESLVRTADKAALIAAFKGAGHV